MSFSDVQWGTAADWAAAIGTVLAFGAALWVIYRERVDRKLEELRRREEVEGVQVQVGEVGHDHPKEGVRRGAFLSRRV